MNAGTISLVVWHDAVSVEADGRPLGFFKDEVGAISAAIECILMQSSSDAHARQLPEIIVRAEYKKEWIKAKCQKFERATHVRHSRDGRKVVRVSSSWGRDWADRQAGEKPLARDLILQIHRADPEKSTQQIAKEVGVSLRYTQLIIHLNGPDALATPQQVDVNTRIGTLLNP